MPGSADRDRHVEELRRALYRRGSGVDEVRDYRREAVGAPAAIGARMPVRPRAGIDIRVPVGRIALGAIVLLILVALPTPAVRSPVFRLPTASAGTFSPAFTVPIATSAALAAADGRPTLWSMVRGTPVFSHRGGAEVAVAGGRDRVFAVIPRAAAVGVARSSLTVLVACRARSAEVAVTTIARDFDMGYQADSASTRVPCSGVQCVVFRVPVGETASAISVAAAGPTVASVVSGIAVRP